MARFQIQIEYNKACPKLNIADVTEYPEISETHLVSDFNQYAKMYITYPNGESKVFSSFDGVNYLYTPSEELQHPFDTCLTGLFTAKFIALPTPRESGSEDCAWDVGDCFYFEGKIYKWNVDNVLLPAIGFTNAELIETYLADNEITEIQEEDIPSYYVSEILIQHWCTLFSCYKKKLEKINCLIVKNPTRDDLCEVNCGLLEEVLQLHYLQAYVLASGESQSQEELAKPKAQETIKKFSNYVNEICCCKKCCDEC